MTINVGILHYKTIDKTIECISSIQRTEPSARIYVIDNFSNDGSLEKLKTKYKGIVSIHFICLDDNLGFARANNFCMRTLREKGEETVVLTNNDIVFSEGSLDKLLVALKESDSIIAAPQVLNPEGEITDSVEEYRHKNIYDYFWNRIKARLFKRDAFAKLCKERAFIKTFSGCCFACNLQKMQHIDYMDENTFLYYEEPILSAKIDKAGFHVVYEPSAVVVHYHGMTTAGLSLLAAGFQLESQMYYMKKYLKANKYLLAGYVYIKRIWDRNKYHSPVLWQKQSDIISFILNS